MTWELLKRCLTRQYPKEGEMVMLTPFGRAWVPGPRYEPYHPGWVLYWIKLPSFDWREDFYMLRHGWHQAVLFWHGLTGFEMRWIWVEGQQYSRTEMDEEEFC